MVESRIVGMDIIFQMRLASVSPLRVQSKRKTGSGWFDGMSRVSLGAGLALYVFCIGVRIRFV